MAQDAGLGSTCEFGTTMVGTRANATTTPGVVMILTPGPTEADGYDTVGYYIPAVLAPAGSMFTRLRVVVP